MTEQSADVPGNGHRAAPGHLDRALSPREIVAYSLGGALLFIVVIGGLMYRDGSWPLFDHGSLQPGSMQPLAVAFALLALGALVMSLRRFMRTLKEARLLAQTTLRVARVRLFRPHAWDVAVSLSVVGAMMSINEDGPLLNSGGHLWMLLAIWALLAAMISIWIWLIPRVIVALLFLPSPLPPDPGDSSA